MFSPSNYNLYTRTNFWSSSFWLLSEDCTVCDFACVYMLQCSFFARATSCFFGVFLIYKDSGQLQECLMWELTNWPQSSLKIHDYKAYLNVINVWKSQSYSIEDKTSFLTNQPFLLKAQNCIKQTRKLCKLWVFFFFKKKLDSDKSKLHWWIWTFHSTLWSESKRRHLLRGVVSRFIHCELRS